MEGQDSGGNGGVLGRKSENIRDTVLECGSVCVCMDLCICTCTHVCTSLYMCMGEYVCVHVYTCICILLACRGSEEGTCHLTCLCHFVGRRLGHADAYLGHQSVSGGPGQAGWVPCPPLTHCRLAVLSASPPPSYMLAACLEQTAIPSFFSAVMVLSVKNNHLYLFLVIYKL